MRNVVTGTLILIVVAGCAGRGGPATDDPNLITLEEVQATNRTNAYDIVRALRPRWLVLKGPSSFRAENPIQIYIDGTRMGGPSALETVPKIAIEEIRYYRPTAAQSRWGLNHTNGAIAVITRRG